MKLRSHILLLVLGTLVPVLIFSAGMVVMFGRQEQAAIRRGALETARALAVGVDRELQGSITTLEALATSEHLDSGNLRAFYRQCQRVAPTREVWNTIILADPSGRMLFNLHRPFGSPLPPMTDLDNIREAIATRRPLITDLRRGTVSGDQIVAIRVPVLREGQVKYVLSASFNPRKLEALLRQQALPEGGSGTIFDRKLIVLAGTPGAEARFGMPAPESMVAEVPKAPEGWVKGAGPEGTIAYQFYSRSPLSGWTVALGIPAARVDGPLRRSLWAVAGVGLLCMVLGAGLALLWGWRIAGSMANLSAAARALVRGEAPAQPPAGGVREVAEAVGIIQKTGERLHRLQAIADVALAPLSLDKLLGELLERIRQLLACDVASILLVTQDGRHLVLRATSGLDQGGRQGLRVPMGQGIAGRIAASRAPLIIEDISAVEVFSPLFRGSIRSVAGVPLMVGERLVGVLHVATVSARRFTGDDVSLLGLVGDRAAVAIERARLYEAEQRARAEAEAANRAKDEFLATVSHEVRAPLNAILMWVQLLRDGTAEAPTAARGLEAIERNTKVLAQIIADLLDISRIIAGKLLLEMRLVDLAPVVEAALDIVRPAAQAKGIRLASALQPPAGPVMGDPDRLQQVVWNLLSNAVKFTPRGGRVDVRLERVGSQARLTVADTGQGIAPDFLPYVFDRFRQADASTSRAHGGLGLGLAIARHLLEMHAGTVRAESPGEGQGATFTLQLPLVAARWEAAGPERMPPAEASERYSDREVLGGLRVLVVDDDADSREVLVVALERWGAEVVPAASVPEAIAAVERVRPDVLVSDIGMPGEDGYALIRKVRALGAERGGGVPAVALTGYARGEDRERVLSAGYQAHVPKPVKPSDLATTVAELAKRGDPAP